MSLVAANPEVRAALVSASAVGRRARRGVVEGRDIGSVVFPDAALRSTSPRPGGAGPPAGRGAATTDVERRDAIDSTPRRLAADGGARRARIDTTGRSVDDVVEEVLSWLTDGASS